MFYWRRLSDPLFGYAPSVRIVLVTMIRTWIYVFCWAILVVMGPAWIEAPYSFQLVPAAGFLLLFLPWVLDGVLARRAFRKSRWTVVVRILNFLPVLLLIANVLIDRAMNRFSRPDIRKMSFSAVMAASTCGFVFLASAGPRSRLRWPAAAALIQSLKGNGRCSRRPSRQPNPCPGTLLRRPSCRAFVVRILAIKPISDRPAIACCSTTKATEECRLNEPSDGPDVGAVRVTAARPTVINSQLTKQPCPLGLIASAQGAEALIK